MEQVFAWLASVNIKDIIVGLISGALIIKLIDEILLKVFAQIWPEKYLQKLLIKIEEFDDKYIDTLKEKYPKAGKALEEKISTFLMRVNDIVLDKQR